jgi:hypothetical protein
MYPSKKAAKQSVVAKSYREVMKVGERRRDFSNASLLKRKLHCHDKTCIVCARGLSRPRKRLHGNQCTCTTVNNATTASATESFTDSECDDCHDDDDDDDVSDVSVCTCT